MNLICLREIHDLFGFLSAADACIAEAGTFLVKGHVAGGRVELILDLIFAGPVAAPHGPREHGNNIDIELLSSGIYEAMVTTVGGLIVGIIAYVFHAIITTKIQKVVNLLEGKATEFMDVLNEPA